MLGCLAGVLMARSRHSDEDVEENRRGYLEPNAGDDTEIMFVWQG